MNTDEIFDMSASTTHQAQMSGVIDKHKNLFDELEKAENINKHRIASSTEAMDTDDASNGSRKRKRAEMKQFRGKESIFKRPEAPLSKCLPVRQLPGFRRNPSKWTKYSLDTVSVEDVSDRGNTAAALSFLRELEDRKQQSIDSEADGKEKPVFQKTAMIADKDSDKFDDKLIFKGSKVIMPEYVVGQKKKSVKKSTVPKEDANKRNEIKLDHLLEYEDE